MISATRGSPTSTSPISSAGPVTTFSHPFGSPASSCRRASARPASGACGAGLSTVAHPAASAGAILWATRLSGKLNGAIAPTTPIGTRIVNATFPSPPGDASIGSASPATVRAATAAAR